MRKRDLKRARHSTVTKENLRCANVSLTVWFVYHFSSRSPVSSQALARLYGETNAVRRRSAKQS